MDATGLSTDLRRYLQAYTASRRSGLSIGERDGCTVDLSGFVARESSSDQNLWKPTEEALFAGPFPLFTSHPRCD